MIERLAGNIRILNIIKFLTIIVFLNLNLIFIPNLNNNTVTNVNYKNDEDITKTAKFKKNFNPEIKINHILIQSNEDFYNANFQGNGTKENPFIIENFSFNGYNGPLIKIQNTNLFFIIRENNLNGLATSTHGIYLVNVVHGTISRNIIENNTIWGILVVSSNNINIENNLIKNNSLGGINSYDSSDITIDENAIHQNNLGISFSNDVKNSLIERNSFVGNKNFAVLFGKGNKSNNPTITSNNVLDNAFINNSLNLPNNCQASDWGSNNGFSSNYWNDLINYTLSPNGHIDKPYIIDSKPVTSPFENRTQYITDGFPIPYDPVSFLSIPLILLQPAIDKKYDNIVTIQWTESTGNYNISYVVEVSKDKRVWNILADNLTNTSFQWNSLVAKNGKYYIKVTAYNYNTINESIMSENPIDIENTKSNLQQFIFNSFFTLVLLIFIIMFLIMGFIKYKSNKHVSVSGLVESFNNDSLRTFFHKIIIGIENAKLFLIEKAPITEQLIDTNEYTALVNIFPDDIKNEMKSFIKGKTVLILTELAYQPLENSHSAFISEILSIPRQTVSDEIKRLTQQKYIQPAMNHKTLIDARFKYYTLTKKGILFLHLLKESIRVTLMQVHNNIE